MNAVQTLGVQPRAGARNHANKPDEYDGNRANYETFRRTLELYAVGITGDRDKIITAISFLTKGDADAWAQNFMQIETANVYGGTMTWAAFLRRLDEKFLDPRVAEIARDDLNRLRQNNHEAGSFFLRFDELRVKAGYTSPEHHDGLLVDTLRRNMNPRLVLATTLAHRAEQQSIKASLNALHRIGQIDGLALDQGIALADAPISYEQFRALAIASDPELRRHGDSYISQLHRRAPAAHAPTPVVQHVHAPTVQYQAPAGPPPGAAGQGAARFQQSSAGPRREPDVVPMDIDRQRSRNLGLCYRCKQPGHLARDCKAHLLKEVVRAIILEEFGDRRAIEAGPSASPTPEATIEDFTSPQ